MANINQFQLSQLKNLQNVSQETLGATKNKDGADFLSLLNDIRARNSSTQNINASVQAPNFSGSALKSTNPTSLPSSTQAFLSNMENVKGDNLFYNAIDTVNKAQIKSDKSAAAFAAGYGDELQVVLDVSKAEKYLQFFSEVRVKFVNAIKELARTQI